MKGNIDGVRTPESDETYPDVFIEYRSLSHNHESNIRTAWNWLEQFTSERGYEIDSLGQKEVLEFCEYLKTRDTISEKTAESYVGFISSMVNWFIKRGEFNYNPFAMVLEDSPFSYDPNTVKKEIPIETLRDILYSMHPQWFVITLTLLKTGIRRGEAINLDERDIHLDHPISESLDNPRNEIKDKPDTIYIDSSISKGEIHNGEKRMVSNKPNSYRALPIDQELKDALVWYVAMSPPSPSPANPLFRNNQKAIGSRYSDSRLAIIFRRTAKEHGVWEEDQSGFSPHWCRHWFTTMLRANIDSSEVPIGHVEGYVGGLRGDTGNNVIETYTHEWSEAIGEDDKTYREVYEDNIPNLLTVPRLSNYE